MSDERAKIIRILFYREKRRGRLGKKSWKGEMKRDYLNYGGKG
jgi:hypothetical protein